MRSILVLQLVVLLVLNLQSTPAELHSIPLDSPVPEAYFGMHIHRAVTGAWPSVPFGSWRLWDAMVAWPQLQPRPDTWNFETLDRYVDMAEQHHVEIVLPLGLSPQWASARPSESSAYKPGNAAPPKDAETWRNYVRTVGSRYKGRIKYFEIWNEPSSTKFWTGSMKQLVTLVREASQILKEIDASNQVISPACSSQQGTRYLRDFLSEGGGQYVDVIGYHFYVYPRGPEAMVLLIDQVHQIMNAGGVGKKPLWDTEAGWSKPSPFPSDDLAADYLTRAYVINWAAKVSRFFWYSWDNQEWVSLRTVGSDGTTPTAAGLAYGVVYNWLVHSQFESCDISEDHISYCRIRRSGRVAYIVWNSSRGEQWSVPGGEGLHSYEPLLAKARPLSGKTIMIGPKPVLVE